jgi:hypothetical protein
MRARKSKMGLLTSLWVLAALLCVLVPPFASAAITHNPEPFSPLDGLGSGLTFNEPGGVAIDEATGNVFVTDGGFGHERIAVLGGEGAAPAGLGAPYEISEVSSGADGGIAYDNSPTSPARGTLYVYNPETEKIDEYARNPTTERYESTSELTIPDSEFRPPLLSTDASGDLYVSAPGGPVTVKAKIFEFSPSGTLTAEYVLESNEEGGPLRLPGQLVVDSAGDLIVAMLNEGVYKFPANGSGEIDPTVYTPLIRGGLVSGLTINPSTGHVFVGLPGRESIVEYSTSGDKIDEFGVGVIGVPGELGFDADSGRVYVADVRNADVDVFGPALTVPTIGIGAASNITGTKATLNGSVNSEGIDLDECFFEWGETSEYGHTAPCKELPPTDSEAHAVGADISGLEANGATYHFRLVATNKNGKEVSADRRFETAETVATEAAVQVDAASATLNGTVRPEGLQETTCTFEYGLTTSAGFEKVAECEPTASELPADFAPHPVAVSVAGLQSNSTYKFRLTASNEKGSLSGKTLTFTTQGPPQFSDIRARDADQTSATLEAKINPSGFGTSYRFEWGPTTAYGHSIPAEFEPYIGAGEEPVLVTAKLAGLAAGTPYHYRLVATSASGTGTSADQVIETLDSCGLPDQRCFEMVSPRDRGPVARPGKFAGNFEPHFQAAPTPGSLAYGVESGQPDASKGMEVLYWGTRTPDGWSSSELSPPIIAGNESLGGTAITGRTMGMSEDLSCGIVESNQPLTTDPGTRLVREAGGNNLYVRDTNGSYIAITNRTPEDLGPITETDNEGVNGEREYVLDGFSQNCGRVVFSSYYHYPGIESVGGPETPRLYEWENGTLRSVGFVPGPNGEVAVHAIAGTEENHANVVSAGGSRVFFKAEGEIFVREHGATHDLSASETSTPDNGTTYQYASKDGSRVFFTANAGLTDESVTEGEDLYEYDLEEKRLTDLSVDHEVGGAEVGGFVGASEDGSHVYFIARGQLVPGGGKTFAQNESDGTYSLYGEQRGEVKFVATIGGGINELEHLTVERQQLSTSQASPDGRYLLFQSLANVTSYEAGHGAAEAYLYDADAGSNSIVCISCRQDGRFSIDPEEFPFPLGEGDISNPLHAVRALAEIEGQAQAYFTSYDSLASGAVEGKANIYEWVHGQVFLIATEPPGIGSPDQAEKGEREINFVDASADGTDLYFTTPQALNWENAEERWAVYDARIDGGFPEPPLTPSSCDADSEGSCRGASTAASAPAGAASSTFAGPGNLAGAPVVSLAAPKPKAKLTRAQQLAKALKACRKPKAKARRVSCEKSARLRYGTKPKAKAKSGKKAKSHKGGK